jgi:putative ABC transport system permease protein
MALGASRRNVLGVFLRQGLALTAAGLCVGIAGAFFVSQSLTSLLFGVTPMDPLNFLAVSLVLLAVASAASYLPARRAAAIDPMAAIRSE